MEWIKATTAVCCFVLFLGLKEVEGAATCELSPYKPVKSVSQITTKLQNIVNYCEKKIVEIEARKKGLENQLKQLESQNFKHAKEKREKEKKVNVLNEEITKLQKEIVLLQQRISTTAAHSTQVAKRIEEANRRIAAASTRVNQLQASIRGKQAHIDALQRKINREKAKRRCFGRKRRSVRAPRVRRGWRVRRVVRKVVRETRRVVKQVVTLPKCVVDNIVSRLTRAKEKAEREKNNLNRQLLQAQREKVNIEGDRRKLIAQRNEDSRVLGNLNASLKAMRSKLSISTITKVKTDREICLLNARIVELTNQLRTTDKQLKFLRETKTKVLSILTQLKSIRNEKLADLTEMEEAGEDVGDLLEEIGEINESIKKSVQTLIQITCSSSFNRKFTTGGVTQVKKLTSGKC